MALPHRIRRQRWQVTAADPAQAFALRELLRLRYEAALAPAVEAAFDECAGGERDIHLQRLEIRVKLASPAALESELPALLRRELAAALAAALPAAAAEAGRAPAPSGLPEGRRASAFHYLVTGDLPWFEARRDGAEIGAALRAEVAAWSEAIAPAWDRLAAAIPAGWPAAEAVAGRLVPLLDGPAVAAWLDHAVARAGWSRTAAPVRLCRLLQTGPLPALPGVPRADRLQALVLAWALAATAAPPGLPPPPELERLLAALFPALAAAAAVAETAAPAPGASAATAMPPAGPAASSAGAVAASGGAAPVLLPSAAAPTDENAAAQWVRAAGLVLLHPFLERCFTTLGLAAGTPAAILPAALPKAAALLHWLATGRDEAYEFELGTIKVLLGLTPADPLPPAAGLLGDGEREEGGALLAAALAHWGALKNTSVEGLRLSFLQRPGLLARRGEGWLLRPEPESFDLLLGHLPWGIGVVKLPWMTRPLFTEWPMG